MNVKLDSKQGIHEKPHMIFFFWLQGSIHILDTCHKYGLGNDHTRTIHLHSGNQGFVNLDSE